MTATQNDSLILDTERLATLKEVALAGGLNQRAVISYDELSDRLELSTELTRHHLQQLVTAGHVELTSDTDEQLLRTTESGRRLLLNEYDRYRRLFDEGNERVLGGTVEDGLGEGEHYISLPGYAEQFEAKLGYRPYAGTLNIRIDEQSAGCQKNMPASRAVDIDGWSDEERTYGPASCYPVLVEANGKVAPRAHILVPDRTHHDSDLLEVIAPTKLRELLELTAGSDVQLDLMD